MSLTFPASPSVGDTYTVGARTWSWSGTIWEITGTIAAAGSIGTTELADSAITSAKIAAGAVVEADIADGAVTTAKIAAGAVVEADIASNAVTSGKLGTDVQLGYRNVIINGAMQVAQRGTSTASITTAGYYTADRFRLGLSSLGTWTQSVEADAPTGSGFRNSLKVLCTTANASPATSDNATIAHRLEGQNLQQFLKGTASAKSFALSFWVKSNVTGTFIANLVDSDNTRSVSASYTISASATWEKKTIVFPADTTGAFDNDNNESFSCIFFLGVGPTFTSGTLNTTWESLTNANRAVGQTNLAAATSNYWQITGVQLEAGAVATPFEFENFGTTLAKCQRYYENSYNDGVAVGTLTTTGSTAVIFSSISGAGTGFNFKVRKRATPAVRGYPYLAGTNNGVGFWTSAGDATNRAVTFGHISQNGMRYIQLTGASTNSWYEGHYEVDAEL
jgi:hypothetical protein